MSGNMDRRIEKLSRQLVDEDASIEFMDDGAVRTISRSEIRANMGLKPSEYRGCNIITLLALSNSLGR